MVLLLSSQVLKSGCPKSLDGNLGKGAKAGKCQKADESNILITLPAKFPQIMKI